MHKRLLLFACLALSMLKANAAYVPITLTGYKVDVVANGSGPASASTSSTVPAAAAGAFLIGNYAFMAADFNPAGTAPTSFLPTGGVVNSSSTPGLSYQLASYSGNNSIMISNVGTDSLVFATPTTAGEVEVLATSGDGASTVNMIVNFTDGTSQAFNAQTVPDWYNATTGVAIIGLGRVNLPGSTTASIGNDASNPRLYEIKLLLSSTNFAKSIRSVTFNKTSTGSELVVMAISISTVCSGPVTAGTVASSAGTTACSGVNFTLSLPTASAGVGMTYQWQSSTTGGAPWTTIAAATGATYTTSQTAATSYRAYIVCNGGSADTSTPIAIGMKPANQCYCVPVSTSGLTTYYINNFATTGGTSNVTNASGAGTTSAGYSDYSGGALLISGMQGTTINFTSAYSGGTFGTRVWVDWNQNGSFSDAGEQMYISTGYASSVASSFQIPLNALPGTTRLRIRADFNASTGPDPCNALAAGQGEAEDYKFTVIALPNCAGTPVAGTTTLSMKYICPTETLTLTSSGNTPATGLTNQWQSSPNGTTWTDITGATTNPYSLTGQTVKTYYRNKLSCTITSSPFVYSSVDSVGARACYCSPTFTSGCGSWRLTNVTFGTINNSPSTCTISDYLSMSTTVTAAVPFPMSITSNQYCASSVFIDLNNDGDFNDADELLYQEPYSGATPASTVTPNIIIPGYASGQYRLRVMCAWGTSVGAGQACNSFQYGNFHDYTVNVLPATPCVAPAGQPTALTIAASSTIANLSFTAPTPAVDRYLIVRTLGNGPVNTTPVNGTYYNVGSTLGNGIVVSKSSAVTYADNGLTPGTTYTYTIFADNELCLGGPLYNTVNPLIGTVTTASQNIYSWNGSVSNNWTVAGNWTPARNILDPTDILQFNNGIVDTANNIPNQTIGRLVVTNNTTAYLQAAAANTLTITDTVAATADLSIASGSSLISNGNANPLTLAFSGANNTVNIAGTLESVSNAVNNVFNFANTTVTVTATGTIAEGGSNSTAGGAITNTTATNFQVNGLFNYKYTTNTISLPLASFNTGSTMLISGYTTVTGGPNGNQNQTFYNFTYNCPNQTTTANWSGTGALNVLNNFTVTSTGTGTWQYATTQAFNAQIKNYIQTGGTFDLAGASATTAQVMNISGNFTKSGGTLKASGTTAASQPTLNFNGTTAQTVSLDASPTGQFVYRVSNNAGINLVGTGGLTTLNINNNGGVRISTTAANPITTTMTLAYGTTNTTLYYDTTGSYTMTANVFPTTAGPQNLAIATGNSNNLVTMPFSRTIPGILTMTSGDIGLGTNTLTLGTSATAAGTLTYTAGNIRVTTGSMIRWFGTSGLPTSVGNTGLYPIAAGSASRAVNIYFSTATALSTGGTIGVGHTNASGFTPVTITDGAYNVTQRTNASWSFTTGNGIVASGTIGARIAGNGLLSSPTPADLRMVQAAAIAGTYVAGSAPANAQRSGLSIADLAVPYYIGSLATNMTGVYIAVNSGPWSVGSTWDIGTAPTIANDAYINSGVTVTSDAATNAAKSLNILPGGTLTAASATSTVTIDSALQNNGTVNVTGGTLIVNGNSGLSGITNNAGANFNISSGSTRLGPVNGGNKPFANNGTLTVSGGTLNVNGNLALNANSTFNQSGGNINVDGNASNVLANSVAASTPIINILTPNVNLTAGTLTLVDPHLGASTNSLVYNVTTTHVNASGTHTFRAGDGTSVDTGFNASYGMSVNTNVGSGRLAFMNVVVNGGTAANSWLVLGAGSTGVLGNFTVNAGGEYRQGGTGTILYLAGNLVNNGTYSALGTTYFGNFISGTISSALAAQTVSGTGTFRNLLTSPTAKFYKLQANNNANVTLNIGDVPFSNNVTLTAAAAGPSRFIMSGTTSLMELSGASSTASATAGWVVGRYQKAAATGGMNHNFPIGDLNYYTPVNVSGTAATAGAIGAKTTTGDHPNLGASTINLLASVNRYYTIDTLNGLTFTAGTMSTTLNWNAPDMDPNLTPANLVIGTYRGTTWTYPTVSTPTATSIKATGLTGDVVGQYVIGEPCGTINIVNQPVNVATCAGSPATFRVTATPKAGLTYQWKKGTTNITGATDSVYTIPATVAGDAGNYSVVITSGCTSVTAVTSATATLTINAPAAITTQPAATQSICEGRPATFTVTATGSNLTYRWRKNGNIIPGQTGASYTIPVVASSDAANYTVDVIGALPCGIVTSNISALTVKPLPLTITAATAVNFCPGGSVVLNAPTTPSTLTYQWRNNSSNITGQTGNAYTATTTGSYTALITNTANGCSDTSNAIAVSVNGAPMATISPANAAVFCQNGTVRLHGLNTPGLTYEWYRDTNLIPGATDSVYDAGVVGSYTLKVSIGAGCSTISIPTVVTMNALPVVTTTPSGNQAICLNDTLTINTVAPNSSVVWKWNGSPVVPAVTGNTYKATAAGSYTVTATSNITGCVNTSAAVTVIVNPLPTVTVTSVNASTFCEGGKDTLRAAPATGLTYAWNRNGSAITPAATDVQYVATQTGSYTVTVTDGNGCRRTSAATTVTANPLPNVIITPSVPLAMCQGQTNNLCVPTGTGLTYVWMESGNPIPGATSACYGVTAAGSYSVKVTNTATGCTATSTVSTTTISPVPTATVTNTGTGIACAGDTVCLNANTGTGLSYQWKINGTTNIPGATSSTYCATNSGNYTVTVTNASNCSVTSAITTLTFNPRPTATISYTTPVTFCDGGAVVLTGVSDIGTTYQWQNNGGAIPGATSNNFIASSTGSYSVIITAANGCSRVSSTILVVSNPIPNPVITRTNGILSTGSYASYQWYFNSTAIPGATNQSYLVTQNGAYAVSVTDFNNCTNYSDVYFFNNVGVPQLNPASIKVFPNPVHSVVNIQAPAQVNVVVRDLTGRMVMKLDDAKQLDMSKLADGTYMLMISDKNGNMVKMDKVLKVSDN